MTELKNTQNCVLVCVEEAPILKMCFTADQQAIWVNYISRFRYCAKISF